MKNIYFLFFIIPFLACKEITNENKLHLQPKKFTYSKMKAPFFFEKLVANHYKDFYAQNHSDFETVFQENNISQTDSLNIRTFYTLKILHKLFTCKNASNGSKGEILNIPYFWHWVSPNPRYDIISIKNNKKLNEVKAPKEFSKYKSYADIDRTPYLFLSELLSENDLYTSNSFGNFSTFGWCSEREMAFVCLLKTMNYKGKVITSSNHSWSEFIILLKTNSNQIVNFKVTVDNTFDDLEWDLITNQEILIWKKQTFKGQGNWYNEKAHSETEKINTENIIVSTEASNRIEQNLVNYLKK